MLTGRNLPRFCNRVAYLGSFVHCIIPRKYLIVTPQDVENYDLVTNDSSISSKYADEKGVNESPDEEDSNSDDNTLISTEASAISSVEVGSKKK